MRQDLTKNWHFNKDGDSDKYIADVPGCVHTDLRNNMIIEDSFYRMNEIDQQWIGESDWIYEKDFKLDDEIKSQSKIVITFEGLDTYATIYLNNRIILETDNMFRRYSINITDYLKEDSNSLKIIFKNTFKVNKPKWEDSPFKLLAGENNDQADMQLSPYSRKAMFHYGWDWGPRFITCGIWRGVFLEAYSDVFIDDLFVNQYETTENESKGAFEFYIESLTEQKAEVDVLCNGEPFIESEIELSEGQQICTIPFTLDKPKLWWPQGYGEQILYTFILNIKIDDKIFSNEVRTGFKTIELIQEDDTFGKSFFFRVNGVDIFAKGANYIPQDSFQSRVKKPKYHKIIKDSADANFNMLRVWGGGIYEDDLFYDLCDKYGILVWQDFMFACGMFPADESFLDNVANEVKDNVKRLRNHPSIALYCGNNENEIGWDTWGWKDKYSEVEQKQHIENANKLFYKIIPETLKAHDPNKPYHPSSPNAGRTSEDLGTGDTHYWGVWHSGEPFSNFKENISRFMSEYGFQSYPNYSSILKFTDENDRSIDSEVMLHHQRCMADGRKDKSFGNRQIRKYLDRDFKEPKDFRSFLYVVQLLQAKGIAEAIKCHRMARNNNYCMGTLYWQLNDCWPVASWSSIDYYGVWKALHYRVKSLYASQIVIPEVNGNMLNISVVSDLQQDSKANCTIKVSTLSGDLLLNTTEELNIPAASATKIKEIDIAEFIDKYGAQNIFIEVRLEQNRQLLNKQFAYICAEKELNLPNPGIVINSVEKIESTHNIKIKADNFAKGVSISHKNGMNLKLSDNYFDLPPNEEITIECSGIRKLNIEDLEINSLIDSF